MKTLFIALLMTTSLLINAQQMEDKLNIQETISKMFINSDNQNWTEVEAQFAPKVTLDYSSMTGNLAEKVSPTDITTGWKTILPGFTYTHHQIGNFITKINGNKANSFCYGTATHYLEDDNGNVWTVVGSYDFDLEKVDDSWKITSMTFNYKYQNGNSKLIENAIKNVKNN